MKRKDWHWWISSVAVTIAGIVIMVTLVALCYAFLPPGLKSAGGWFVAVICIILHSYTITKL